MKFPTYVVALLVFGGAILAQAQDLIEESRTTLPAAAFSIPSTAGLETLPETHRAAEWRARLASVEPPSESTQPPLTQTDITSVATRGLRPEPAEKFRRRLPGASPGLEEVTGFPSPLEKRPHRTVEIESLIETWDAIRADRQEFINQLHELNQKLSQRPNAEQTKVWAQWFQANTPLLRTLAAEGQSAAHTAHASLASPTHPSQP